ncbi:hypothetical protein [Dysgonomonas massiliensis]|uniref:hypothetical protein n=1 Tax=Dysgonomonas massiliensis TaxID=2040292 RepID=UPI000C76D25E|nr:hypothetical protein [Dysgonomonas massiliensis]
MENNNQDNLEQKDIVGLFEELKDTAFSYIDKRIKFYKLEAFEKLGIVFSLIGFLVIALIIVVGLLFFGLFGLAFFLGELMGSLAGGFGVLFLFLLLCLILVLIFQRPIRSFILNKVIIVMRKIDRNEEI